ncbi:hypothetical protein LTR84_010552 [Exophiala bonariae]|uniref:alpha-L-rhamnosidase n=1 Tax=Exophiala bonariae TaxID=1690606 RepID=A0AAV9MT49_9EURO|nr:hypothetical protein LTR84_010552 [Exophiala bonariae]
MMKICDLRIEHYRVPLGIGERRPRISWSFERVDEDWVQQGYEISIQRDVNNDVEIFAADTAQSLYVEWPTRPLQSQESAILSVRALSHQSIWTAWSEPVQIETGLLDPADWKCSLIQATATTKEGEPLRPVRFRRDFHIQGPVRKARLYITAHGVYEASINGAKVGDHVLAPGWTSYDYELPYQTFDVLELLQPGSNTIGVEVAEGWFCGRLGFMGGQRDIWGSKLGIFAEICVTYDDGHTAVLVGTDHHWQFGHGPLLQAEIYNGESFNAAEDVTGWNAPSFSDKTWKPVVQGDMNLSILKAQDAPPVRRIQTISPQRKIKSPSRKCILDFGQNLVGWVECKLDGPAGREVKLVHTEVLENGECATAPLREAKCTDTILLAGTPLTYEPRFTFHGFRYVQVDGYTYDEVDISNFTAVIIHTDMARTGFFECSDPMLNKLHENVLWSMKGNFLSVPTDCPQRDERLGWTGDVQAFAPTASFLYNTNGILKTWLRGLAHEQHDDPAGVPPLFSPNVWKGSANIPAAIWGDSIINVPWDLYQASGDTTLLQGLYPHMVDWMTRGVKRHESGLWDPDHSQLGDWLEPTAPADDPGNGPTDEVLVSDAFLIRMTDLMSRISLVISEANQGSFYAKQAQDLRTQFSKKYITQEGRVVSDTQTALALAIQFSLFPSAHQLDTAAARLVHLIKRNSRFKIATGFAGTPILGHALNKIGQTQLFYRMLFHRKPPSWLYPITMGATTIWERWDSMLPDGSLNASSMTSFNHYALGAVANWMHATIAGIAPLEPGWKKVRIAPVPGATLTSCRASFRGPYGEVSVAWELRNGRMFLQARVPGNTSAEITLPGEEPILVGAGNHEFDVSYANPEWPPLPIYPPFVPHDDDEA